MDRRGVAVRSRRRAAEISPGISLGGPQIARRSGHPSSLRLVGSWPKSELPRSDTLRLLWVASRHRESRESMSAFPPKADVSADIASRPLRVHPEAEADRRQLIMRRAAADVHDDRAGAVRGVGARDVCAGTGR